MIRNMLIIANQRKLVDRLDEVWSMKHDKLQKAAP